MSLILRQKTEQLLKDAGLPEFHIQINNKYLTVVGQCGQIIVTARGIQFSKNVPSKAEIDYAVELFETFLEKHIDTLREYKKARMEEKTAIDNRDKVASNIKFPLRSVGNIVYLDTVGNSSVQITLDNNGELKFNLGNLRPNSITEWENTIKLMKKHSKEAINILQSNREAVIVSNAVNAIRIKLSTCSI